MSGICVPAEPFLPCQRLVSDARHLRNVTELALQTSTSHPSLVSSCRREGGGTGGHWPSVLQALGEGQGAGAGLSPHLLYMM